MALNFHGGPKPDGSQDWSVDFQTWRDTLASYGDGARFALMEWGEPTDVLDTNCPQLTTTHNAVSGNGGGNLPFPEELFFYSYNVHQDPVDAYNWGFVEYGYPPSSEFWTIGTIHAGRSCADQYIG